MQIIYSMLVYPNNMEVTSEKGELTIDVRREEEAVAGAKALSARLEGMGSSTK